MIIYRKIYLGIMMVALLNLYFMPNVNAEPYDKAWLISRFNKLDSLINKGEGYSKSTNDASTLMWAQSYLFEAYLDMYEVTHDEMYLIKFVNQADGVCKNTDKSRGLRDYKGRLRTGWGVSKFSQGKQRVVSVPSAGMILYPMMRFSYMVKEKEDLIQYRESADKYVRIAEEAVSEFEEQWFYDVDTGEGYYRLEGDEPNKANPTATMAFNGPLSLGRVLVLLYRITGKETYLVKAKALAVTFKRNLILMNNGAYMWGYRPDLDKHKRVEDISHGAIEVGFVIEVNAAGIVFGTNDLQRFAKTIKNAFDGDGFSTYVNGRKSLKAKEDYSRASGRWLDLCLVDCDVYLPIYNYFIRKYQKLAKEHPAVLLGFAKLAKYYDLCFAKV